MQDPCIGCSTTLSNGGSAASSSGGVEQCAPFDTGNANAAFQVCTQCD